MARGIFISFEGSEGCGKSTQVERLAKRLQAARVPLLVTREPGGTAIGETIRDLLKFAPEGSGMTAETELLLFEASRSQLVREVIEPALHDGTFVIADRFFDSTTVYQGAARRLDAKMVEQLNMFAVGDCQPDITFVLHLDAQTARERLLRRVRSVDKLDRLEREPMNFYERVSRAYLDLAQREPERVTLIDGAQTADKIEKEIWSAIARRFPQIGN